jgi:hypothetical protein
VTLRNRYLNCLTADRRPVAWQPPAAPDGTLVDSVYFGEVLAAMDARLASGGLTVVLTQDLERLPSYGRDVVAVVIGDELARVPAYVDRVRAVFKNQPVRPRLTSSPLREPSWTNLWWLVSHLRTWRHHLPGAVRWLRSGRPAPVWHLPIGVLNQVALPLRPPEERGIDVFFAGSVSHRADAGLRERVSPKVIARREMVAAAERLAAAHPSLAVQVATTGAFAESLARSADAYSRQLADARIALVPRGTTADTARFWQAMRAGCVVVTDTVPRHRWFYDGAPVVRVARWRELEDVVPPLLADPGRLRALHDRSLDWWRTRGAPEALGAYMAERLDRL